MEFIVFGSCSDTHDTVNVPIEIANTPVYFWQTEAFITCFKANPNMSIGEFVEALPLDGYGEGQVANALLLWYWDKQDDMSDDPDQYAMELDFLWQMYEDEDKGRQIIEIGDN